MEPNSVSNNVRISNGSILASVHRKFADAILRSYRQTLRLHGIPFAISSNSIVCNLLPGRERTFVLLHAPFHHIVNMDFSVNGLLMLPFGNFTRDQASPRTTTAIPELENPLSGRSEWSIRTRKTLLHLADSGRIFNKAQWIRSRPVRRLTQNT